MAFPLLLGAGALMGGLGGLLGGNSANAARKRMQAAVDLPGLDIDAETTAALQRQRGNIGMGSQIAGGVNRANRDMTADLLESSVPGYGARKGTQAGILDSWLAGEVPKDVQDAIQRSAAARSLSGGYGGSGMGRNLFARDLGLTSLDMINRGMDYAPRFASSIAGMEMPNQVGVQSFLGPGAEQQVGLRADERAKKQMLMAQLAGMPGKTAGWGGLLSGLGGLATGMGLYKM